MEKLLPSRLLKEIAIFAQIIIVCPIAFTQPVNDDCTSAIEILVGKDEATATRVNGDTRGATASTLPTLVCSGTFYTDDVWFRFSTVDSFPTTGIVIRVYFNSIEIPTDLPYIGMAIYNSCDSLAIPIRCFSDIDTSLHTSEIYVPCLDYNADYFVRIWSGGNTPATEGTFRIAVFQKPDEVRSPVWWETFDGGLEANGWSTEGSCAYPDSNQNAGWKYLPTGLIDKGAYALPGTRISSTTLCDGAVGVDDDYNDNGGIELNFGGGPCPAPGQHILISPEINTTPWNKQRIYMEWEQALRHYQSQYFISVRWRDEMTDWSEWSDLEVNTEFIINGNIEFDNKQRHFLPGVEGHDYIQLRFIYNSNYYFWAIDDVKLFVSVGYTDLQIRSVASTPWFSVPVNQAYPYYGAIDISNNSYEPHTNVRLSHTIIDNETSDTVYQSVITHDTILLDELTLFNLFQPVIDLGANVGNFTAISKIEQDQVDIEPGDNVYTNTFQIGGDVFAHEDGPTRNINPVSIWHKAPPSFGYGNIFRILQDIPATTIYFGVSNPSDLAGKSINLNLVEWEDQNNDQRAQPGERTLVGATPYLFTGNESDNSILQVVLENTIQPGQPIMLEAGKQYMAMVEYKAISQVDPTLFLLASEERDYTGVVTASDSAYHLGLIESPIYMTVFQFSPDGVIDNIDFEVRELNPSDNRIHLGDDIVPVIRLGTSPVSTNEIQHDNMLINVSPNPATDIIQVNLEFTKPYDKVKLLLIDNLGRILFAKEISQHSSVVSETIHVAKLAEGSYRLHVETSESQRSIPVVIVK